MPPVYNQLSDGALGAVLEAFYEKVRQDPALGPVFARAIAAHLKIEGISPALFERWLALFEETCRERLAPELAAELHGRAVKIAESLQAGLLYSPVLAGLSRRPALER